ncbi:MAG: hypothetical protein K8F91_03735 [Candidatus Obscuribacterales bacterium]|nr:hypothetical protein [Candidatus Obscuribacterales bacterium]
MSEQANQLRIAGLAADEVWNEIDVGTRLDENGKTTYHVLTSQRKVGFFVEKIYGANQNLVKIVKRGRNSRSETDFDASTGDVCRIFEAANLPDGSSMTKEITYNDKIAAESVIIVGPSGELKSTIQRESVGIRTLFQGQTDYKKDGTPSVTVNHAMDADTGKLAHREQIKWLLDGQRALTEHFYFEANGSVGKYTKIIYHANGGPFIEETHRYGEQGHMLRREIIQYNPNGVQTAADMTVFDESGEIGQRSTTYYDHRGSAIMSYRIDCSSMSFSPEETSEA